MENKLEDYYSGDEAWNAFVAALEQPGSESEIRNRVATLVGNQYDLAIAILYHCSDDVFLWLNSSVPALDGLTPAECALDPELVKRLREMLMRMP